QTHKTPYIYMDIQGNKGVVQDPKTQKFTKQEIALNSLIFRKLLYSEKKMEKLNLLNLVSLKF
ncbi:hypothetical protein FJR41_016590, partial [Dolichospermum planctonicum UHCC 0167]|uniref:hypothetical protein n=1 Tax=Dolichospermum planctonicum TaxID=136072 RepID=UPI001C2C4C2D